MRDTLEAPRGVHIVGPGDEGWDAARAAWNLAVDQRPAAVAFPDTADDVVEAVRWARDHGLRVMAQATGHAALVAGPLDGTLLVRTERMREVEVDPERCTVRVGAGVIWEEVAEAAGEHGLAALAGSSHDVGVAGYALGGGCGWLGRRYGLAANSVVAAELVTADGRLVRADADHEPDLFWALRGGGGAFGVVTALELRLFPVEEVVAGILWWPIERSREVLQAWRELTERDVPDELTTVGRYLRLPPIPEVPEPLRGKSFVVVQAIHLGERAQLDRMLEPLRALGPVMDTIGPMPARELSKLHMDPPQPVPYGGDGVMLAALPPEAIDAFDRVAGPEVESPLLSVEIRHLGGELGRAREGSGAVASLEGEFGLFAVGITPTPEAAAAVEAHAARINEAMAPWAARHMYCNFAETRRDPESLWTAAVYERLCAIKTAVDPDDVIRSNHPLAA
jgi:FAD binding domain